MTVQIMVIGGGLSGLRTAQLLLQQDHTVTVLESRNRTGGRITSERPELATDHSSPYGFDMGPSWFWPWQERMLELLRQMHLEDSVFEQFSEGMGIGEYADGTLSRQTGLASMAGSLRLAGGLRTLTEAMAQDITPARIHSATHVKAIHHATDKVTVIAEVAGESHKFYADKVIIALPPRIIVDSITFSPDLPEQLRVQMQAAPTWMAGQAKFVAVYDKPFWRRTGLSGDAMSQIGPLGEIHDASSSTGYPYALFGFVGIPAAARQGRRDDVIASAIEQLVRLFGPEASEPVSVHYKDWAEDKLTSTIEDSSGPRGHVQQPPATKPLWNQSVFWAGSETSSVSAGHNGYLEGALAAAHSVVAQVLE